MGHGYCVASIVAVLAVFLYFAHREGWLPAICRPPGLSGFVGAYGRTPGMQGCMAFNDGSAGQSVWFNRCAYV